MRAFIITLATAAISALPCAASSFDERIIVVGEDADQRAVPRTDDSYGRVVSVIQNDLSEAGYFVIDEQMLSAKLNIDYTSDRRRQDIVGPLQAANAASDPSVRSRLAFVFSIIPVVQQMTMTNHLNVRVRGDIFDLETSRLLRSAEVRTQKSKKLPSDPVICNDACLLEAVGNQAVDVADELADQLILALDAQREEDAAPNIFRVSIADLEMMQAIKMMASLKENEAVSDVSLLEERDGNRIYAVQSALAAGSLQEAILMNMIEVGVDVDQVSAKMSGTDIMFAMTGSGAAPDSYSVSISGYSTKEARRFSRALLEAFGEDEVSLRDADEGSRAFDVATDMSPLKLELKLMDVVEDVGLKGADISIEGSILKISKSTSSSVLNPNDQADARDIQAKLKEAGFYDGTVDGLWGNGSRKALQAFKKAQDSLPDDAAWDLATQTALMP